MISVASSSATSLLIKLHVIIEQIFGNLRALLGARLRHQILHHCLERLISCEMLEQRRALRAGGFQNLLAALRPDSACAAPALEYDPGVAARNTLASADGRTTDIAGADVHALAGGDLDHLPAAQSPPLARFEMSACAG